MGNQTRTPVEVPASLATGAALVLCQLLVPGAYLVVLGAIGVVLAGSEGSAGLLPILLLLVWLVYCSIRYGTKAYRGSDQARWAAVGFLTITPGVAGFASANIAQGGVLLSAVIAAAGIRSLLHSQSAAYCAGSSRPPVEALGMVLRIAGAAIIAAALVESASASSEGYADRPVVIAGVLAGGALLALAKPAAEGKQLAMGAGAVAVVGFALTAAIAALGWRAATSAWATGSLAAIAVVGILAQYLRTQPKEQPTG